MQEDSAATQSDTCKPAPSPQCKYKPRPPAVSGGAVRSAKPFTTVSRGRSAKPFTTIPRGRSAKPFTTIPATSILAVVLPTARLFYQPSRLLYPFRVHQRLANGCFTNPRGCYPFRVHARLSSQLLYRIYWGGVPRRACAPRPAGGLTPCGRSAKPFMTILAGSGRSARATVGLRAADRGAAD